MPVSREPENDEQPSQGPVWEPEPWEYERLSPRLRDLDHEIYVFQEARPRLAVGTVALFAETQKVLDFAQTCIGSQHRRIQRLERDMADAAELNDRKIKDIDANFAHTVEDLQGVIANLRKENAALIRAITRLA